MTGIDVMASMFFMARNVLSLGHPDQMHTSVATHLHVYIVHTPH